MIRRDKWEVVEGSDGFSSEELKEDAEKSYRQGWGEVGKWSRGYWLGAPLMIDIGWFWNLGYRMQGRASGTGKIVKKAWVR